MEKDSAITYILLGEFMNDNMFDYFSITDRVDMFSRTYDINPINSTYIESLCVFTKKKE